jgi:hypothetical protein
VFARFCLAPRGAKIRHAINQSPYGADFIYSYSHIKPTLRKTQHIVQYSFMEH